MGQRSRKRGRRAKPSASAQATRPRTGPGPARAPQRNRLGPAPAREAQRARTTSSSAQRDASVRARLLPLAPGERPWPIRIATLLALLVGGGDLVEVLVGGRIKFGSAHAGVGGVVLFSVMMLICAVGMWQMRYWAVLGFQAILAIVILLFSLLLIRASNLLGFVVAIAVVGLGGLLFYKLVRVLSRIQMPKYPGR